MDPFSNWLTWFGFGFSLVLDPDLLLNPGWDYAGFTLLSSALIWFLTRLSSVNLDLSQSLSRSESGFGSVYLSVHGCRNVRPRWSVSRNRKNRRTTLCGPTCFSSLLQTNQPSKNWEKKSIISWESSRHFVCFGTSWVSNLSLYKLKKKKNNPRFETRSGWDWSQRRTLDSGRRNLDPERQIGCFLSACERSTPAVSFPGICLSWNLSGIFCDPVCLAVMRQARSRIHLADFGRFGFKELSLCMWHEQQVGL